MFEIDLLPAREGDAVWIRYGTQRAPRQILIDAGRKATAKVIKEKIAALPDKRRRFELLVITHVDRDHIEGAVELLEDPDIAELFKQVWFNGYTHLLDKGIETFGAIQGERVTSALLTRKPRWNRSFRGRAVAIRSSKLPRIRLPGGMALTVLSPDLTKLAALRRDWEAECRKAGLIPGQRPAIEGAKKNIEVFGAIDVERLARTAFVADTTRPNGTSIGLLAEYAGKRALFAADAHVDRLLPSIKKLQGKGKLRLDVLKVSHHGSERNTSQAFLEAIDCPTFAISTNGSYFQHPTKVAVARIIKFGGPNRMIVFNYRSRFTRCWDAAPMKTRFGYATIYPPADRNGEITIAI